MTGWSVANDWYERPCRTTPVDPGRVTCTGAPSAPLAFPNCFAYEDVLISHLA